MFAPWCPACAARMLLGPRRVEGVEQGPDGPRVILRCFCGTVLVWSSAADAALGDGAAVGGERASGAAGAAPIPVAS